MRTISAAIIENAVIDWIEQLVDVDIDKSVMLIGAELDKYLATLPEEERCAEDELRDIAVKKTEL